VFRVDRENRNFTLMAEEVSDPSLLVRSEGREPYRQNIDAGMLGKCLERKSVLVVNDVDGDEENYGFIKTAPGQRSAMTVPLFLNGRVEMILDLESTERNSFVGPDREAARGLAADCEQIFAARWRQVIDGADEPDRAGGGDRRCGRDDKRDERHGGEDAGHGAWAGP
jgi:hypothetical protein